MFHITKAVSTFGRDWIKLVTEMLELVTVDLNNDHESVEKKENLGLFALVNRNKIIQDSLDATF